MVEAAEANDALGTGNVVFATLVDDPASVGEIVDAYLGEIMVEAASASDSFDSGFSYDATINESLTAADPQDATITTAPTFTTWNPADLLNVTLSNANLTATCTPGTPGVRSVASHSSGKYYFEYTYTTVNTNSFDVGVAPASYSFSSGSFANIAVVTRLGAVLINNANQGVSFSAFVNGNIVGVAIDLTAQLIWFRLAPSGNWNTSGTANPATGTGGFSISALSGTLFGLLIGGNGDVCTANFGASGFTGSVPSGFTSGF
jgi:hypothetical protein